MLSSPIGADTSRSASPAHSNPGVRTGSRSDRVRDAPIRARTSRLAPGLHLAGSGALQRRAWHKRVILPGGPARMEYSLTMTEGKIEHAYEVVVNRPSALVFALLTDFEKYLSQWAKGPVAVRKLTAGDTGSGTRFEVTARVAGIPLRSPYDVTGFDPDRRLAGDGIAGPFRFSEEYTLSPEGPGGDQTRLHYTVRADPRGIFKLARRPLTGPLRRLLNADIDRFKSFAEGPRP
jgi:hypothetical protein